MHFVTTYLCKLRKYIRCFVGIACPSCFSHYISGVTHAAHCCTLGILGKNYVILYVSAKQLAYFGQHDITDINFFKKSFSKVMQNHHKNTDYRKTAKEIKLAQ